jgi:hypothetical protein
MLPLLIPNIVVALCYLPATLLTMRNKNITEPLVNDFSKLDAQSPESSLAQVQPNEAGCITDDATDMHLAALLSAGCTDEF